MLRAADLVRSLDAAATVVRRDRLSQAALVAWAILAGFSLAGVLGLVASPLSGFAPFLFPALAVVALRRGLDGVAQPEERHFWNELALTFGCWLAVDLLRLLPLGEPHQAAAWVLRQALLAAAYALLLLAVDRQPHQRFVDRPLTAAERLYTWPTVSLFVLGQWFYFSLIPSMVRPEAGPWPVSDDFLLVAVNVILALRLFFLAGGTSSGRWRATYTVLSLAPLLLAISEAAAAAARWVPLAAGPRAIRELAFVVLVVAAGLRRHPPRLPESAAGTPTSDDAAFALTARNLAFALAFPLVHFAGYLPRVFDEPSRQLREVVVFAGLVLIGGMAVFQYRLLEKRAERLWVERKRFEQDLSTSQQDLRLILERHKADEAQRIGHKKFELAFHSCPYAITINRLRDGRFVEVNPTFERWLGYSRDELIGHTPTELGLWSNPGDRFRLARHLEGTQSLRRFLVILRTRPGESCMVLMSAQRLEIRGTKAVLAVSRQVTSQWEEVEEQRRRARLVDQVQAAVYAIDRDGRVRHWNHAAEDLLGFSVVEILGRPAAETFAPPPAASLAEVLSRIDECGCWQGEMVHLDREGQEVGVTGWGTRVGGPEEKVDYRLMILEPA